MPLNLILQKEMCTYFAVSVALNLIAALPQIDN